ncbi:MAG: alpha/beta hydrolase [Candidatus Nomurabacteria bacterium]|nr:alpha/beta hydrolase [Candidatus Nomurabacteria bacterium]
MQEHTFEDRIYYRTNEFKLERLTLVFAHGASGSSSAWLPYEKIFENKYNVLTYDIRGHGMSKKYKNYSDYEIKNFANDLHDLVTYLKIPKFILISNSFAGLVALQYLKSYRETVIANVFTSPEVYMNNSFLAKIAPPILKTAKIFPFHPKPRGHVDYRKHINSTDWDIKRNLADLKNTTLRVLFYVLRQSFSPLEYDLKKINTPTLIMHGEKDSMAPMKNAIRMHNEIKNSEFVSIPDVDHNTVHNAVKIMSSAIESFIEKNKKNLL